MSELKRSRVVDGKIRAVTNAQYGRLLQLIIEQAHDRAGLEKASCECYAIVKERFDAFLMPPSTAVQGNTTGRR